MEEKREISITLKIGNKTELPLKVSSPEQEALYRRAAKDINEKITQYRNRYPDNTLEDFLSMTAFIFALRVRELEKRLESDPLKKEVSALTNELEEYLKNDR